MSLKLGCDPEIFLVNAAEAFIASCGKVGGSKDNPRPLFQLGEGYAVQEDNVAIEFNIPPANSAEEFVTHVSKAVAFLRQEMGQQGLHFSTASAAVFPMAQLRHPAAQEFGCDPDFNAWKDGDMNPRPHAANPQLRSCGGHIHIGLGDLPRNNILLLIQLMDLYCGVPSVLMDNGVQRRELYGAPGAFRMKPYGVEYRTLSNFWVFDEKLIQWAWQATSMAVDAWQNNKNIVDDQEAILAALSQNNKEAAQFLIQKHNLLVV